MRQEFCDLMVFVRGQTLDLLCPHCSCGHNACHFTWIQYALPGCLLLRERRSASFGELRRNGGRDHHVINGCCDSISRLFP